MKKRIYSLDEINEAQLTNDCDFVVDTISSTNKVSFETLNNKIGITINDVLYKIFQFDATGRISVDVNQDELVANKALISFGYNSPSQTISSNGTPAVESVENLNLNLNLSDLFTISQQVVLDLENNEITQVDIDIDEAKLSQLIADKAAEKSTNTKIIVSNNSILDPIDYTDISGFVCVNNTADELYVSSDWTGGFIFFDVDLNLSPSTVLSIFDVSDTTTPIHTLSAQRNYIRMWYQAVSDSWVVVEIN